MSGLTPVSFKQPREAKPRLSAPYVPGRRHPRFWTNEQDQVLREHYPVGGLRACQARLPEKAGRSIYAQAHKLGLSAPSGGPRTKLQLPADIDARVRAGWPLLKGRGAVQRFADELGVPRHWLTVRVTKLGLTLPHRKEPRWTDAERALMRKVPLHNPGRAAEIFREHGFRRSPTAIVMQSKRLDLSRRTHETLSARGAAKILGVDDKWITARCIAGELKAARRETKRLPQQGGDVWAIEPVDLRGFVVTHLEQIDIRKVEKFAFVQLLVDAEARA